MDAIRTDWCIGLWIGPGYRYVSDLSIFLGVTLAVLTALIKTCMKTINIGIQNQLCYREFIIRGSTFNWNIVYLVLFIRLLHLVNIWLSWWWYDDNVGNSAVDAVRFIHILYCVLKKPFDLSQLLGKTLACGNCTLKFYQCTLICCQPLLPRLGKSLAMVDTNY